MSAWLALVLTDVVAVATFARCFTGPGELTAALVTLLLVHLVGLEARARELQRREIGLGLVQQSLMGFGRQGGQLLVGLPAGSVLP